MENPKYWTPLHYEFAEACSGNNSETVNKILEVLAKNGLEGTAEDIQFVLDQHDRAMEAHLCGQSLRGRLVSKFKK